MPSAGALLKAAFCLWQGVQQQWGQDSRPIVLALSNPTEVAECTAEEAYDWSQGRAVYASGTAFAAFRTEQGQMYVPAQANNSLIFPGQHKDLSTCLPVISIILYWVVIQ